MSPVDYKKYPFTAKIRHHVSANNYMPVIEITKVPENYPPAVNEIDWRGIFSNSLPPNALDIGCGKGIFLIAYALNNPNENILGIEIRTEAVDWINSVTEGEKIGNCRALYYSVANKLPFIKDSSIEKIFYLFPDPWPKRKHFRRRAFNYSFVEECYRVLKPNSKFFIATDVDYVNEYHLNILNKFDKFNVEVLDSREKWDLPTTNKENFCIKKDIPVFRLICTKK